MKQEFQHTENQPDKPGKRLESDAKKLADRHMADPNHVITEEELKSIRVGVTGEADAPTEQAIADGGERIADKKADSEDDLAPGAEKMTPWDTVKS